MPRILNDKNWKNKFSNRNTHLCSIQECSLLVEDSRLAPPIEGILWRKPTLSK